MKAETIIHLLILTLKTLSPQQNTSRKENQDRRIIPARPQLQASGQNPRNHLHDSLGNSLKTRKSSLPAKTPRNQKTAKVCRS